MSSFPGLSVCPRGLIRSLGQSLWSGLAHGRIARVLFCVAGEEIVLLHGFIKKTRKTPKQDLDLALKRMKGDDLR